jgi:hypothetical protein
VRFRAGAARQKANGRRKTDGRREQAHNVRRGERSTSPPGKVRFAFLLRIPHRADDPPYIVRPVKTVRGKITL